MCNSYYIYWEPVGCWIQIIQVFFVTAVPWHMNDEQKLKYYFGQFDRFLVTLLGLMSEICDFVPKRGSQSTIISTQEQWNMLH